jgi:ABC-type branched-subunit amino acid transport system permease subunit
MHAWLMLVIGGILLALTAVAGVFLAAVLSNVGRELSELIDPEASQLPAARALAAELLKRGRLAA